MLQKGVFRNNDVSCKIYPPRLVALQSHIPEKLLVSPGECSNGVPPHLTVSGQGNIFTLILIIVRVCIKFSDYIFNRC